MAAATIMAEAEVSDELALRGSASRTVRVRDGEGFCELLAPLEWSVWELKLSLEPELKALAKEQHLYFDLRDLDNEEILYEILGSDALEAEGPAVEMVFRGEEHAKWFEYIRANNGWMMSMDAPSTVKLDREIMLMSVKADGDFLRFAEGSVSADSEVVYAAVCKWPDSLRYATSYARGEKDIVCAAVEREGNSLRHARGYSRSDRDIVLAACRQDGWALHWAAEHFRDDREVVLAAVSSRGRSLNYASDRLRADKEVALAAVSQDGMALEYTNDEFRKDGDVVVRAVRQNGRSLQHVDISLRHHRIVVQLAAGLSRAPWPSTWDELVDWYETNPDKVYPPKYRP